MNKRISAGAVLIVAALYFFGGADAVLPLLCAIAVHELGHASVILLAGGKISSLRFDASGLSMTYTGLISPRAELLSIAMGPITGILCGLAALSAAPLFSYISLFLSAYNLLPALPLDGGRLLYNVLRKRKSMERAEKILTWTGILSGAAIILMGLYILYRQMGVLFVLSGINILIYQMFF